MREGTTSRPSESVTHDEYTWPGKGVSDTAWPFELCLFYPSCFKAIFCKWSYLVLETWLSIWLGFMPYQSTRLSTISFSLYGILLDDVIFIQTLLHCLKSMDIWVRYACTCTILCLSTCDQFSRDHVFPTSVTFDWVLATHKSHSHSIRCPVCPCIHHSALPKLPSLHKSN